MSEFNVFAFESLQATETIHKALVDWSKRLDANDPMREDKIVRGIMAIVYQQTSFVLEDVANKQFSEQQLRFLSDKTWEYAKHILPEEFR